MANSLSKSPLQVYLRRDQVAALRILAEQRNVSLAELVRQGVDRLLVETPAEADPLWGIVALGNSGLRNLAEGHDDYLAEVEQGSDR